MRTASFLRCLLVTLLFGFGVNRVACADEWRLLRTPHFNVLSEAADARTRAWAVEFELFRRAMEKVMPVEPTAVEPVTLVLFRSDRRLRPFKPQEKGKPSQVAAFFVRSPGQNLIAMSIEGARDDVREVIFHEAVHWHLSASERRRPLWLEEGLAEVFGNFRLSGNTFVVGGPRPEYIRYVRAFKRMPYATLAAISPGGLVYGGKHANQTEMFYYESWALVHALLFGTEGVGTQVLAPFLAQPSQDADGTRDIERGFGVPAAAMDAKLSAYLERGRATTLTVPFDRAAVEKDFSLSDATAAEVDLALGRLLVGVQRPEEGEGYLWRAAAAAPTDGRVNEALALLKLQQHHDAEAERQFRDAVAKGQPSYVSLYFLGECQVKEQSGLMFGEPNLAPAAKSYIASLKLNPRFMPALEGLSRVAGVDPAVLPEAAELVRQAGRRYPVNAIIQLGVALIEARDGHAALAQTALAQAKTAAETSHEDIGAMLKFVTQTIERAAP